jgi:predicted nucleic acid-binding protein
MPVFFDTNVFLYAARPESEPRDAGKRNIAIDLIANEDFAISSQVLAEFYHNSVYKGEYRLSHDEALGWLDSLAQQPCIAVDVGIVKAGALIAERYQISYWDGAMIAAAHELGATVFYSEDLSNGQGYGAVTVVNPFKSPTG